MRSRLLNRGKTSGRVDDTAEIIEKRLVTFHQETEPVLVHYKRLYAHGHIKVLNVNGQIGIEVAQ
jgi:adenylate kinase family enzyme